MAPQRDLPPGRQDPRSLSLLPQVNLLPRWLCPKLRFLARPLGKLKDYFLPSTQLIVSGFSYIWYQLSHEAIINCVKIIDLLKGEGLEPGKAWFRFDGHFFFW